MEEMSSIPISVLIIVAIWLTVLVSIMVSKYKNRDRLHLENTERRSGDRRSDDNTTSHVEKLSDERQRRESDRRNPTDWKSDFLEIRDRIEEEMAPKDY